MKWNERKCVNDRAGILKESNKAKNYFIFYCVWVTIAGLFYIVTNTTISLCFLLLGLTWVVIAFIEMKYFDTKYTMVNMFLQLKRNQQTIIDVERESYSILSELFYKKKVKK